MPIPKLSPAPGESYDASQKPPPFGHALKHYFALDDDYVNLNHGILLPAPFPMLYDAYLLVFCRFIWLVASTSEGRVR